MKKGNEYPHASRKLPIKGKLAIRRNMAIFGVHVATHILAILRLCGRCKDKPRHEKTCLRGFQPGLTQIRLCSHRG